MRPADLTDEARAAAMLAWDREGGHAKRGEGTLYRSEALEWFTRSPPWLPYVVVGPLALVALVPAVATLPIGRVVVHALVGALGWTLLEYLMHRFLFHARAESEAARVVLLLVHGHHHVWPDDPNRIAATPLQFGSLALLLWGLFSLALARFEAMAAFAGFLLGYLAYEAVHYLAHHGRSSRPVARWLRHHHMQHHHQEPSSRWGISSPFWDVLFRSEGRRRRATEDEVPDDASAPSSERPEEQDDR